SLYAAPPTTAIYTLSLHDALPICERLHGTPPSHFVRSRGGAAVASQLRLDSRHPGARLLRQDSDPSDARGGLGGFFRSRHRRPRSEEHTSELQSRSDLVCRLLLEK